MVARQKLTELARRKELVRAQCDLHRAIVALECQNLGDAVRWADTGMRWARRLGPWMPIAAGFGGLAAARHGGKFFRFAMKAVSGYQLVRGLMKSSR